MDEYRYGTSMAMDLETPAVNGFSLVRIKTKSGYKRRFVIRCLICATILAAVMAVNMFGGLVNERLAGVGQRVKAVIAADSVISETVIGYIERIRDFFKESGAPESGDDHYGATETEWEREADTEIAGQEGQEVADEAAPTDYVDVDLDMLNEINGRNGR